MGTIGRPPSSVFAVCVFVILATFALAQGSYRAQLRGIASDASGAVVPHANVTITDSGTNISHSVQADDKGEYYFSGLRPSS